MCYSQTELYVIYVRPWTIAVLLVYIVYCSRQVAIPVQRPTPEFDSFWLFFFEVLREAVYHAKFLYSESKVGQLTHVHSCNHSDALQAPRQPAAKFHTHLSVVMFTTFLTCSVKFTYCKLQTLWKLGNEAISYPAF